MNRGKIFGIGLSRTATRSLAVALHTLGLRTQWFPSDPTTYAELMSGKFELSILRDHDALTDTPVVPYYPQFDKIYPQSKFILTVRDKDAWLRSAERHWNEFHFRGLEPLSAPYWRVFAAFIDSCVYGCHAFNADRFSYVYDTHVANVKRYFHDRPQDLLIMDICAGQGWEVLCPFLERPVPNVAFPRVDKFNNPPPRH